MDSSFPTPRLKSHTQSTLGDSKEGTRGFFGGEGAVVFVFYFFRIGAVIDKVDMGCVQRVAIWEEVE